MTMIDDVLASIEADRDAVERIAAVIAGSRAEAEALLARMAALGVTTEGHALGAARQTLEECEAQCAALSRQLEEAAGAAVAAKGGAA